MNQFQKKQVFYYTYKIIAIQNEVKLYKNMLYYINLEHERIHKEIKKHSKELEVYDKIKSGEKTNSSIFTNISSILECENLQKEYQTKINHKENEIKKYKDLQDKLIKGNTKEEFDLNKIFIK